MRDCLMLVVNLILVVTYRPEPPDPEQKARITVYSTGTIT